MRVLVVLNPLCACWARPTFLTLVSRARPFSGSRCCGDCVSISWRPSSSASLRTRWSSCAWLSSCATCASSCTPRRRRASQVCVALWCAARGPVLLVASALARPLLQRARRARVLTRDVRVCCVRSLMVFRAGGSITVPAEVPGQTRPYRTRGVRHAGHRC